MSAARYVAHRETSRDFWRVLDRRSGEYVKDTACAGRAEARSIARTLNYYEGQN